MPILQEKIAGQLRAAWHQNRSLFMLIAFSLLCLFVSLLGLLLDRGTINGELAWAKPCKFSVSLAIYGFTLIWFSHYLTRHKAFFQFTCRASFIGTVVELLAIIMQVVRGTSSHFNSATGFDHCVFAVITTAIMPIAFSLLALFAILLREENLPEVLGLSLKLGVFVTLIGLVPGILMLLPEGLREHIFCYRQFDGHTIGTGIYGHGIPFIGWNAIAGDLRVAHFMGIHALQVLPFLGLLFEHFGAKLSLSICKQRQIVWNASLTYLGFVLLLTWQALRSESIAAPSTKTVAAALVMLSFSALGLAWTMWYQRSVHSVELLPSVAKIS